MAAYEAESTHKEVANYLVFTDTEDVAAASKQHGKSVEAKSKPRRGCCVVAWACDIIYTNACSHVAAP